jgi:hypothetical protein
VLTYCTNIHPGESWADVVANLEGHALPVKRAVSPDRVFPLGLRVSGRAAGEVTPDEAKRFRDWCEAQGFSVPSLNGFPHGRFHGAGVKERVYLPDWRDPERARYTRRLADLLADWLPTGVVGSISTAPVAFRRGFAVGGPGGLRVRGWEAARDSEDWRLVRTHLIEVLTHLEALRQARGVEIVLAFEPEPRCVFETTPEAIAFFARMDLPASLADLAGLCFDCCHQAVEVEEASRSLAALRDAGVRIAKVQVSSALRAVGEEVASLSRFDEPVYLHQVVARDAEGALHRYDDLGDFVRAGRAAEEVRVHFHVPIFAGHLGPCGTTRAFLEEALPLLDPAMLLEVETYSFDVLPAELRKTSVGESIVRELEWVRALKESAS